MDDAVMSAAHAVDDVKDDDDQMSEWNFPTFTLLPPSYQLADSLTD